jgi:hypothetical protein
MAEWVGGCYGGEDFGSDEGEDVRGEDGEDVGEHPLHPEGGFFDVETYAAVGGSGWLG